MKSSYLNDINYGDIISSITFIKNPQTIIEIGILNGYSLSTFINNSSCDCNIYAYDIFDKFNGNHANYDQLIKNFSLPNVHINYGDFYELYKTIDDNSIDILHIDIANNGDVLNFTIDNYMKKLKNDGILVFEGGSQERDNVEWMNKYEKTKILPIIKKLKSKYKILTIGTIPSLTIIMNQ